MAGQVISITDIPNDEKPYGVRRSYVSLKVYCANANSTTATFEVTLRLIVKDGYTSCDDLGAAFTVRDTTSGKSTSVTLTATYQNQTVTGTSTFTCGTKTDVFIFTQSAGSPESADFIGTQIQRTGQIYWTSGSGGGGGGSGTGSYTLYLGQANLIYPNTTNPPYPNANNANDSSATFGYLAGSNGTNSNSGGIWNPITFSSQNGSNTFYINGNTVKYNNVTYTATSRNTSKYRFVGWNQNANSSIALSSLAVGNNVYVQAYFEEIPSYTITYNANGGSGAPSSQTKRQGISLTLSSTKPTRKGYYFAGWSVSSSADQPEFSTGETYSGDKSITLYAVWYKCAYIYNGSEWKAAIPYICSGSTNWRRYMPYVYDGSSWK